MGAREAVEAGRVHTDWRELWEEEGELVGTVATIFLGTTPGTAGGVVTEVTAGMVARLDLAGLVVGAAEDSNSLCAEHCS